MLRHVYFDSTLLPYPSVPHTIPAAGPSPAHEAPPTPDDAAGASRPPADPGTATPAGEESKAAPR